jgi:polyphenol oxidase
LTTDERRLPGDVPRWEVPEWRERFGVVAGITGRGSVPEPFDLGLATTAPVGEVMARWRAFRGAIPECPSQVIAHQVHGDRVLWHPGPSGGWTIHDGADGHVTASRGLLLLVTVADCVPVYLLAPRSRTIALLHAGWRGTAAGILAKGVRLLSDRSGEPPSELVMHLGVSISGPCYEVGAEVMAGVGEAHLGDGPWHLDLRDVLWRQAAELGLRHVSRSGWCSARDAGDFFSHRRSGGRDGRMVAYLGIPTP